MLSAILERDQKKPLKRSDIPVESFLPKYQDILKLFYVPGSGKICVVLRKGNMYLLESNWEDLNMIRINKKLKDRSYMSAGKKSLWSLMSMKQRVHNSADPLSTSSILTARTSHEANANSKDSLNDERHKSTDLTTSQIEIDLK